jgi:hypothetical protein
MGHAIGIGVQMTVQGSEAVAAGSDQVADKLLKVQKETKRGLMAL